MSSSVCGEEVVTVTLALRWEQVAFQVGDATCVDIDGRLSVIGRHNRGLMFCVKYENDM
jgi:hypothetical protein